MDLKSLFNYTPLGVALVATLLVVVSFGYTYTQAQKIIALTNALNETQTQLAESNLKLQLLESKLNLAGSGEETGETNIEFKLNGEVYGPLGDTKIAEDVIDGSNIIDHSIGESEINSSEVQLRIIDQCPDGYYIRNIDENGHLTCGKPQAGSGSSGSSGDLEEVLLNGNDANNRDIKGVDELEASKVSTDELCLDGDCRSSWSSGSSSSGTPGLDEVLAKDNNANNRDIQGVKDLYAQQVCIDGDCKNKWPELNSEFRITTDTTIPTSTLIKRRNLGSTDEYQICAISEIRRPYSDDYFCRIVIIGDSWYLELYRVGECSAICQKSSLN